MADIEAKSTAILYDAFQSEASDIHFLPTSDGYRVHYRALGEIHAGETLKAEDGFRIVSYFKYACGMDIGERRKPQSKAISYDWQGNGYTLRFSTLPAKPSESLAIRISPRTTPYTLQSLSLFASDTRKFTELAHCQNGLVLFTGATGSGKTTSVYALLDYVQQSSTKMIVTIEDPIERPIDGMVQIETNEKAGITFATALKAVLRHDPDVIVIGEIRDRNTAELALQAATTGHLVIASLHAGSASLAFARLTELGVNVRVECVRAVIHQKLAKIVSKNKRVAFFEWLRKDSLSKEGDVHDISGETEALRAIRKAWAIGAIDRHTFNLLTDKGMTEVESGYR